VRADVRSVLKGGGALAAAALLSTAAPASAAERGPSFTLAPLGPSGSKGYFVWDGSPGRAEGRVRVANAGQRPGVVELYTVDAVTSRRSGVVFRARDDRHRDAGAWATVTPRRLRLAPGESRIVRVRAVVPEAVRPGHHVGGLIAENPVLSEAARTGGPSARPKARFAVKVRTLRGIALQFNVPGPSRERLALGGVHAAVAPGLQEVRVGLENTGDLMLKPKGSIVVTDEQGREVRRRQLVLDTVLPHSRIDYPAIVDTRPLRAGSYQAAVVLRYGREREARYTGSFDVTERQAAEATAPPRAGTPAPRAAAGPPTTVLGLLAALALAVAGMAAYVIRLRGRLRRTMSEA
jgi:hypothetical protein